MKYTVLTAFMIFGLVGCQNNGTGEGSSQLVGTETVGRPGYIIPIGYTEPILSAQPDERLQPTALSTQSDVNPQPNSNAQPVGNTDLMFTVYTPDQLLDNIYSTSENDQNRNQPLNPQLLTVDSNINYIGVPGIQKFNVSTSRALDVNNGFEEQIKIFSGRVLDEHSGYERQFGTLTTSFGNISQIDFIYDGIFHPGTDSLIFFIQRKDWVEHINAEVDPQSDIFFHSVAGMTSREDTYTLPQGTVNYNGVTMHRHSYVPINPVKGGKIPGPSYRINSEGPFTMQVNFDEGHGNFQSRIAGYAVLHSLDSTDSYGTSIDGFNSSAVIDFNGDLKVDPESGRFVGEQISVKHSLHDSDPYQITNTRLDGHFHGENAKGVIGVYKEDGNHNDHYSIYHGAIIGERVD